MKHSTADRLKIIMEEKQIKQIDIVKLAKPYCEKYGVKIGRNDISQYVSGKVKPGTKKLLALAEALHTTPEYLMGWSEEELLDRALMIDDDLLKKYGNVFEAEKEQSERDNKLLRERIHSALKRFPPSYRKQILELTDVNEIAKRLNVTVSWLMGEESQEATTLSVATSYNPIIDKILSNCQQLNDLGQKKVLDFSDDLISTEKYKPTARERGYRAVALGGKATQGDDQPPIEEKIIT